jgi:phage major head subunit gpT-like protein
VVFLHFPLWYPFSSMARSRAEPLEKDLTMIVNGQVLYLALKGFKTVVTDAMLQIPAFAKDIAMTVPSASRNEAYGWLGAFPSMREWLGPRNVKNLVANGFTITNRKPEPQTRIHPGNHPRRYRR